MPSECLHRRTALRRALLACGIAASLLYAAMLVFIPAQWPGHRSAAHTVSELSANRAPRPLRVAPWRLVSRNRIGGRTFMAGPSSLEREHEPQGE
jgi:hypothetical protein